MKPSPFTYHRPESLDEAVAVLAEVGHDGKVLAGGQSLLPIMSMRLAAPSHLVDVNRLTDLAFVAAEPNSVRVGALARHTQVEKDAAAAAVQPLLRQGLRLVAHPTIRNRGTTVGSLAHADPSGEMTAVLALTGGSVTLLSASGRRTVPAPDFFLGPLESAVRPGELAIEAVFPALPPRSGSSFVEVARRHGDYAVCGVAAAVTLDTSYAPVAARTSYISCSPTPVVVDVRSAATGDDPSALETPGGWTGAGDLALEHLDPEGDIHATAEYRRHLVRVLTARALARAYTAAAIAAGRES